MTFDLEGTAIAGYSQGKTIRVWDAHTGKVLKEVLPNDHRAEEEFRSAFPFSYQRLHGLIGSQKFITESTGTDRVKILDKDSGSELALLTLYGENDWLVTTPEGFFDGTSNAWKQMMWRFDNNTFDHGAVELYFNDFFYPDLLQDVFAGRSPKPPLGRDLAKVDRRQPGVVVIGVDGHNLAGEQSLLESQYSTEQRLTMVTIEVSDNKESPRQSHHAPSSGARDVRLFRNGSLVKLWPGDVLKGQDRVTLEAAVPIVAGKNRLTAYAFNSDNVKSEDATLNVTGANSLKRSGTLYVLTIGVNEYQNGAFDLAYAVPDAEELAAELKRQQEKLKNYEQTQIISLYNGQAKKERILAALSELAGKIQPEDAVVVYFAGHGTVGSCLSETTHQVNAKDRFYLVPHDLGYEGRIPDHCEQKMLDEVAQHSISDLELEIAFGKIDAGQMLLVIDACNSGQALESEEKRRGPMNSRGLAQLAYEKGMYVLTASQSLQEAKADKRIAKGHGYLTFALIEGLKMKTAANRDGDVTLRQWVDYAVQRVPQMQEAEAAELRQFVKRRVEREAKAVQTPRVFYRRDSDLQPFVVARP